MRSAPRPERLRPALFVAAGALLLAPLSGTLAEERVRVQGLFDAEVWKTDTGSTLLSKNEGDTAPEERLTLWVAAEITPGLQAFFLGQTITGKAYGEGTYTEGQQAFLRYSFKTPLRLRMEAGRITAPLGSFARRHFSSQNPLIGAPDTYDVSYPLGFQVEGSAKRFDYHAAVIDAPMINEKYSPEPGSLARPALAAGVTPLTGLRFGAYTTWGPYLGPEVEPLLPAGAGWKDYGQKVVGFEVQFSRGYFEINNEFMLSRYEVPGRVRDSRGKAFYVEPKYTWTPRLFTALRLERNDYPYILPLGPGFWLGNTVGFYDLEAGVGYRLGPGTVIKAAYRRDRWHVDDSLKAILPDGYSVSLQLSHSFDVNSWIERPR